VSHNFTDMRYGTASMDKPFTLTDVPAGTVAIDPSESDYFILAGAGATTRELGAPTPALGANERRVIIIEFQHAGDAALTFNAIWLFGDPGAPTYPATGDGSDIITAVWNGTDWLCSYVQTYA
jgi:hypothetical protein